ncbi:unnamed protein product, partial [Mesorhabditis spiculigera]
MEFLKSWLDHNECSSKVCTQLTFWSRVLLNLSLSTAISCSFVLIMVVVYERLNRLEDPHNLSQRFPKLLLWSLTVFSACGIGVFIVRFDEPRFFMISTMLPAVVTTIECLILIMRLGNIRGYHLQDEDEDNYYSLQWIMRLTMFYVFATIKL